MFRPATVVTVLIALTLLPRLAVQAQLIDDFDGNSNLSEKWTALGRVTAARVPVPEGTMHEGVGGKMVELQAQPGAIVAVREEVERPAWTKASHLRFRIRAYSVSAEQPVVLEFRGHSQERRASRWRKLELTSTEWQTVDMPLAYFRASGRADVPWSEVKRLSIYFRDAGKIALDKVELVAAEGENPTVPAVKELAEFAFGGEARTFQSGFFVVVTNAEKLDGEAVLAELEKLRQRIYGDFPKWRQPYRPVVLLVFDEKTAFTTFWQRLGRERFQSEVPVVRADGYAIFGLAGSFYDDSYGKVRPVYIQEACHAMLAQVLGIANTGEWLHEGIANYYQLQWSGQDLVELNQERIAKRQFIPLAKLCNGEPIGMEAYAQATLLIKWMVEDDQRRGHFSTALAAMRNANSTDLSPHCKESFGMSLEDLEEAWLQWTQSLVKE